jgi:hypothetical protein
MLKFFRECKGTALQKIAVPPFANRRSLLAAVYHSPLATRHSLSFHHSLIARRHSPPFFHPFEVLMTCAGMMLGRPIP